VEEILKHGYVLAEAIIEKPVIKHLHQEEAVVL